MLLTWAEFCAYDGANPADTTDQARVEKLIASATAQIEKHCGRLFELQSRTVDEPWRASHTFKAIPVVSCQVSYSFTPDMETLYPVTGGYWLDNDNGVLSWVGYSFPGRFIRRIYSGGFSVIPEDLKEAVYKTVKMDKQRIFAQQLGMRSQISGEITTTIDNSALPYEVRQTLESYRLS